LNILDTQGELINDNLNSRLLNKLDNDLLKIENLYNIEIHILMKTEFQKISRKPYNLISRKNGLMLLWKN
jgi:hypothetical protein